MSVNIYLIKTTHSTSPVPTEVDVNDYYTDSHVYKLIAEIDRSFKQDKKYFLLSNDTVISRPDIKIIDVTNLDLWGWWNKMYLFSNEVSGDGLNIFFDLDLNICRDISWVKDYALKNKITLLYSYWKPIDWEKTAYPLSGYKHSFKYTTLFNSSFMMWHGKQFNYVWEEYYKDPERFMLEFRGNDDYMNHFHRDILNVMPRGFAYSYFYGAEDGSEFFPKDKEMYKNRDEYFIKLMNGLGKIK